MIKKIALSLIILTNLTLSADSKVIEAESFVNDKLSQLNMLEVKYNNLSYNSNTGIISLNDIKMNKNDEIISIKNFSFVQNLETKELPDKGFYIARGITAESNPLIKMDFGIKYHFNQSNNNFNTEIAINIDNFGSVKIKKELGNFRNSFNFIKEAYKDSEKVKENFNPITSFGFITFNELNVDLKANSIGLHAFLEGNAKKMDMTSLEYKDYIIQEIQKSSILNEEEQIKIIDFIEGNKNNLSFKIKSKNPTTVMEYMAIAMNNQIENDFNKHFELIIN